jgi:cellulose synthase/poly-beta-1,6-N-acetylglucosamine synthase-like glycosyltransferase
MLTDFDSTIVNPESIPTVLGRFDEDPDLAGIGLKLVPDGGSILTKLQDIEYATGQKIFGGYLSARKMQRCVPGAAGIWKRSTLLKLLDEHSGRHNGDDLEATIMALRHGYATVYDSSIEVRTSVPQGIRQLFAQRRRWELGALETYDKERQFYRRQLKRIKSRLCHVTILDIYAWITLLLAPLYLLNLVFHPAAAAIYAAFQLVITIGSLVFARNELQDKKELLLAPVFPVYQFVALAPRLVALVDFLRSARRTVRPPDGQRRGTSRG